MVIRVVGSEGRKEERWRECGRRESLMGGEGGDRRESLMRGEGERV